MASSDSVESKDLTKDQSKPEESSSTFSNNNNKSTSSVDSNDPHVVDDEEEEDNEVFQLDLLLKDEIKHESNDDDTTRQYSILSRMIPLLDSTKLNNNNEKVDAKKKNKVNVINGVDQIGRVLSLSKVKEQALSPDDYVQGSLVLSNGKSLITVNIIIIKNMPLMSWCVLTESLETLEFLLDEFEDEFDPILPCLDGPFQGKTCFELLDLLKLNLEEEEADEDSVPKTKQQGKEDSISSSKRNVDQIIDKKKEEEENSSTRMKTRANRQRLLKKLLLIMYELQNYQQKHVEELFIEAIEPNRKWLELFFKKTKIPTSKMEETMIGMARCGLITNDLINSKEDCLNMLASMNDQDMDDFGEFIPDLSIRNELVQAAKQMIFVGKNKLLKPEGQYKMAKNQDEQEIPLWKLATFQILLIAFFAWIFVSLSNNKEYQEMFRAYGMIE